MSRILSVYTNGTGLFDHARSVLMRRSYAPNGAVREGCQTFHAARYIGGGPGCSAWYLSPYRQKQ